MLFDEHLHDAVARERRHQLAEGLRHCEFDLPRARPRWPAGGPAGRRATAAPAATPARSPERGVPPIVGIRRTLPDMYR